MKVEKKNITIDKKKHEVELRSYESLDELITNESARTIVELFNYRSAQLQAQLWKKKIKPRKISIKEKRNMAFELFNQHELQKVQQNAGKFEEILKEKLDIIEKRIAEGKIL
jgi:hypothetical protein